VTPKQRILESSKIVAGESAHIGHASFVLVQYSFPPVLFAQPSMTRIVDPTHVNSQYMCVHETRPHFFWYSFAGQI
jgi:hypothetical protein